MNAVTTDQAIEVRPMSAGDARAIVAFAEALPLIDLLFLQRDIRVDKVVSAWIEQNERGLIRSLLAYSGEELVGCAAVVRDALSWSPHVAEIRVLVAQGNRGAGIGRRLAQEAFALAVADGVEKLIVRIVPEQRGAIALFEEMGFRVEAMLRDHVRDAEGAKHDIAILSLDVLRQGRQHLAYGLG
ncbi:N-acetyltransferase [Sphingomonas sp. DBB INV C78]|uniref:GNAT family N-acetyltransferase n=1 Tax=Sphingomonas sp. DBB INV C78 TaxID=3349434 RepID=UPI0036D293DF